MADAARSQAQLATYIEGPTGPSVAKEEAPSNKMDSAIGAEPRSNGATRLPVFPVAANLLGGIGSGFALRYSWSKASRGGRKQFNNSDEVTERRELPSSKEAPAS